MGPIIFCFRLGKRGVERAGSEWSHSVAPEPAPPDPQIRATPLASTKKSLLEPLSKSKALSEDSFHYFLKSGRWGVRVNQHGRFCRNVPGSFSFFGKRGLLLFA